MKNKKTTKTYSIALTGIFGALALALSFIEKLILSSIVLPMGIKPGFSNIIVMFACSVLGPFSALGIAVIKSGFAALLSGISSGIISLCGGIFSVLTMLLLIKLSKNKISYLGISVISAVMHNVGQTLAASLLTGSGLFFGYLPILLISGAVFGAVTGIILNVTMPYLIKLKIFKNKKLHK